MRPRLPLFLVALAVLLAGACGGTGPGSGNGGGTGGGAGSGGGTAIPTGTGYAITVKVGDRTERLDAARLAALPAVTVDTPQSDGATQQTGPTLDSVLGAAGVTAFSRVSVTGPSESADLTSAEVGKDLLLSATRRGTVKLAGPGLDQSRWVRDVTDIVVTP
ncbi:MAG: hypothetical protein EKK42_24585 [Pseudonocardiaceae bacterium]|nr:MAG: hypothetical protein EKK42_24585 [Pseudonocardiaceae bacterium]